MQHDVYCPGDVLRIRLAATKHHLFSGKVSWSMVNMDTKEMVHFQTRDTALQFGYNDVYMELGAVPEYVTPGTWRMIGTVKFDVNPMREVVYHLLGTNFSIASCGGGGRVE